VVELAGHEVTSQRMSKKIHTGPGFLDTSTLNHSGEILG
jgi:hypothetical protein